MPHDTKTIKTTVYVNAVDYSRLRALAKVQGRPTAELVREAVSEYASRQRTSKRPASIGAGHSGRRDLSERSEKLLTGFGSDE